MDSLRFASREIKEQEGLTYSAPLPRAEFAGGNLFGDASLEDPCRLDLEFSVGGSSILLQGRVQGGWRLPCSRCLAPHRAELNAELEETYPLSQETIDVGEEIRQALVLSVPERSLCRAECKGLCPRCGKNLNLGTCGCT